MDKPKYYVCSFSGGKDSTALVLRLIELGKPLDEVLCCDTTMEFPAMYRHIEKVRAVVEAAGIKFTLLRAEHDFEYYLTEHMANREEGSRYYGLPGYGWPGVFSRWCTKALKVKIINDYLRDLRSRYNIRQYVGLAADEQDRLERKNNQSTEKIYPLVRWGWTEKDALEYCYSHGYDWEGLYELFERVSCWCCPLQPLDELRTLRRQFPELWQELLYLDKRQMKPFKDGRTVMDLDKRFALEDALESAGESIKNRAFFSDLKRLLAEEVTIDEIIEDRRTASCRNSKPSRSGRT